VTTRLAVVMSGFPRTSETFAVGELAALARAGMLARLYATKPGDGAAPQPGVHELLPLLRVLPPGDPRRQADAIADDLRDTGVDGVHGYFAHQPAEVAQRAAGSLGVGYTFSTHALDARKVAPSELADRARGALGVVACNSDVAQHVDVPGARVHLLPHGVDLARFAPRSGPYGAGLLRILAVGRLVEKKGLPTLVEAVARMPRPCVLRIVGTGVDGPGLQALIQRHGLQDRVQLVGRRSHDELPREYAWADVVAVPSVVDRAGDRDGLPNVVLEAMASGRSVVASDVAALGATVSRAGAGLVVPPGDPRSLADALARLATAPALRSELAASGRRYVEEHYDLAACTQRFVDRLGRLHTDAGERIHA
jgi:glycosyltransferase involved in cell wall biosynthesis